MSTKSQKKKKGANQPKSVKGVAEIPKNYRPQMVHLSEASDAYLACLLNPCGATPVGMPFGFPAPSVKVKTFIRSRFNTSSTNAMGFVAFNPTLMCGNSTWTNMPAAYQAPLFTSSGTFAGTSIANSASVGVVTALSNSSYASADFGPGELEMRLVSACLRIRYAGTELDRGGRIIGIIEPDHSTLVGYTQANLLAMDSAISAPVKSSEWVEVIYNGPVRPVETEYSDPVTIDSETGGIGPAHCMALWVNSAVADASFEVECYANFEIIGFEARGKTPTFADATGGAVVASGVSSAQLTVRGSEAHHGSKTFIDQALKAVQTIGKKAISFIGSDQAATMAQWAVRHAGRAITRSLPAAGMLAGALM